MRRKTLRERIRHSWEQGFGLWKRATVDFKEAIYTLFGGF